MSAACNRFRCSYLLPITQIGLQQGSHVKFFTTIVVVMSRNDPFAYGVFIKLRQVVVDRETSTFRVSYSSRVKIQSLVAVKSKNLDIYLKI